MLKRGEYFADGPVVVSNLVEVELAMARVKIGLCEGGMDTCY